MKHQHFWKLKASLKQTGSSQEKKKVRSGDRHHERARAFGTLYSQQLLVQIIDYMAELNIWYSLSLQKNEELTCVLPLHC